MEKFFRVEGTTGKKIEGVILKVGVIPVLIIALPTILLANTIATISGVALASIYLFVFYFMTQIRR